MKSRRNIHRIIPEFVFSEPEAFSLTAQTTADGDRIAAEKQKVAADRRESEKLQTQFLP